MKYCTWKENGKSFIFEDGYTINPYNGDMQYMGEYTIEEMKAMLNIVSAVLGNRHFQQGSALRTSTVYDIDDFDIATMQKWTAYWQQTIDAAKAK